MKFCIATIAYWNLVGFDTEYWRQSNDGLKALVHDKFARTLVPDADNNENVQVYDIDSQEFKDLLQAEWETEETE